MPELPEVETVVRGLRRTICSRTIAACEVLHPKPLGGRSPASLQAFLKGERITGVERFGKYIQIAFQSGKHLVCHLRMTGKFIYQPAPVTGELKHIRLIFHFNDGSCLLFKDMRIFGTLRAYGAGEKVEEREKIGIDPFSRDWTPAYLLSRTANRKTPLKVFLLNQKVVAGLGNIYASEILFHCRLSPFLPAGCLSSPAAGQLVTKTREILKLAIRYNGTSIRDFRNIESKSGRFQDWLRVYGRAGHACRECAGGIIQRVVLAQRSTFYCPVCQPEI